MPLHIKCNYMNNQYVLSFCIIPPYKMRQDVEIARHGMPRPQLSQYSRISLKRGPMYHDITIGTAMTALERKLNFKLTKDTLYLALMNMWPTRPNIKDYDIKLIEWRYEDAIRTRSVNCAALNVFVFVTVHVRIVFTRTRDKDISEPRHTKLF